MTVKYPLVHITILSKIVSDLIKAFILEHCNRNCVFVENLADIQIIKKVVFFICDWHDFVAGEILQPSVPEHPPEPFHFESFYLVINMLKGEEEQLVHSPHFQKIRGLFYVDDSLETFKKGFTAILNDEIWVPRAVLMNWMSVPDRKKNGKCQEILSSREVSVLKLIVGGRSNKEISKELYISANTVKAHLYNIYKKIEVSNRLQAALWASSQLGEQTFDRQFT